MSFNFSNIRNSPSTQSSSHSFPTPSATPFTHTPSTTPHFPPAQNNPNINPTLLDEDVIPAHFIDALANQFSFGDSEQDLWHNLHGFAKAVCSSTKLVALLQASHQHALLDLLYFAILLMKILSSLTTRKMTQAHGTTLSKSLKGKSESMVAMSPGERISGHKWKNGLMHAEINGVIHGPHPTGTETIAKDEDHYKVHVIHNPFMEGVHTDDRFFTGPIASAGLGAAEDLLQEMV
ncbi:hypothetical protein F5J12DRAFT_915886 [Pisolithus orientalis]|uniref:uncharacterized protein n=1 Tax=Pisolithus orientalis TaxID=936130 RepID=UPI002224F91F|nr:uncharacterized protein F5J12DRAFT_915886 [Pisolithus orientalis]KAI5988939.1 hypothetical protein F5J12DRAFT_915886 [Pisolithus orientalis]